MYIFFNWGRITMPVIWAFILLELMIILLYNDNEDKWNYLIFSVICQSTTQFKIMWYWRIKWWLDRTLCLQFHLGCSSPVHVLHLTEIRFYRMRHRKVTIHSFATLWDFPGKSTGVGCHCLLCGFISGLSILSHWSIFLSLSQYHTVLMSVAL